MSEVVENVSEQNSAHSNQAAAPPIATVEDVATNNVDADVKAVPDTGETETSATIKNAHESTSKDDPKKSTTSPKVDNKKTPVKRTPSKRMSHIERYQKESEELVKNMGGSLEIEGGRKTRSSTRGTPTRSAAASTPPPTKKARSSPASGASTPTRPRGRARKIDVADDSIDEEENKQTPTKKKTPTKAKKAATKETPEEEVEKITKEATEEVEQKPEEKKDTTESNPVEGVSASSEQKDVGQPEEDKTDAVLEPLVEETQSQLAEESLPTVKNATKESESKNVCADVVLELSESVNSDSPMDADVEIVEEKITDKKEVKEPTPEPMEIDSSPNTDDDVVEINDDAIVVPEQIKILENQAPCALKKTNVIELENNVTAVEENAAENSVAPNAVATPPLDIVANNSIEKPAAVTDVANINANSSEENTLANSEINKTENDLCEPKIATSPPISAANDKNSVTTPQTCN